MEGAQMEGAPMERAPMEGAPIPWSAQGWLDWLAPRVKAFFSGR